MLFTAMTAPAGGAEDSNDVYSLTGLTTYGAVETRTGEYAGDPGFLPGWDHLMDPAYNRCKVVFSTLEMTGKHTGVLTTVEQCLAALPVEPPRPPVAWDVHISTSGILRMQPQVNDVEELRAITGCGMNGLYPVYRGHFDGESLYAATDFHGICDGGLFWGDFGISKDVGPLHATFEVILDVDS